MNLGSVPVVPAGDTFLNGTSDPGARPGSQAWSRDGRRFRLVKCAAAEAIGAGRLAKAPVPVAAFAAMVPTADVPSGSKVIRVTAGAGAAPANTYAGGLAFGSGGPLGGLSYAVKSHEAIVSGQPFNIVLEPDDAIVFPITAATDRISLLPNPYLDVVMSTTSATIGVAVGTGIPAGMWGFVQVSGLASLITEGTAIAAGQAVSPSTSSGGAATINAGTLPIIGTSVTAAAAVAGSGFAVQLNLP